MLGHEFARVTMRDHLIAGVPARLALIRAAWSATTPADPAAYLLADTLPLDASQYPIVLVQSTSLVDQRATESGQLGVWICEYAVTVVVAARSDVAGDWEGASRQRDRLLLAVRETLMMGRELADNAFAVTQGMSEEIGDAAQDVQSRPLAAGTITLRVRVAEELSDDVAEITGHAVTVDPVILDPTVPIVEPVPPVEEP
jgi:hypothetical protein